MTKVHDTDGCAAQKNLPQDIELELSQFQALPVDERIRKRSGEIAFTVVDLIKQWSVENPFVIHAKTTQGTGKSLGDMETIPIQIGPTAAFGPRHEDIKEDADYPALRSTYEVHFEGKDKSCINSTYEGRHHRVHPDVSANWCQGCPERSECTYHDAYEIVEERGFSTGPDTSDQEWTEYLKANPDYSDDGLMGYTAAHQMLPHHPEVLDQWGAIEAVLIDESPWESIGEKTATLGLSAIRQAKQAVGRIQDREWDDDLSEEVLMNLHAALGKLEALVDDESDNDEHEKTYNQWVALAEICEEEDIIDTLAGAVSRERDSKGESGSGLVVGPLLKALPNIREHTERAWEEYETLVHQRPPKAFWQVNNGVLQLRWLDTTTLNEIASEKPVCVLATEMSSELVHVMFDLPVVTITDDLKPKVNVLQLGTKKANISSLRERGKLWEDLLNLTEQAIKHERLRGNTVFIAVKQERKERDEDDPDSKPGVVEHMEKRGFEKGIDFEIGHYYALTGSNRFENCDAVVLFGMPRLPDEVANHKALLAGLQPDDFHEKNTEGELRDALHRIRPARKDGVRAYIWSEIPEFKEEFTGDYTESGIGDLQRHLDNAIHREQERERLQESIQEFVEAYDGKPTASTITEEVSGTHTKIQQYRDELVEDDTLEMITESDGPGRPSKKYRLSDTSN